MKKILMIAPFVTNGRYKGGISFMANSIVEAKELLDKNNLRIQTLNTCLIKRKESNESKLSLDNLTNFIKLYQAIIKETKETDSEIIYYHTSVKMALFKDMLIIHSLRKRTSLKIVVHIHFADYEKIMTGKGIFDRFILNVLKKDVDRIIFLSKRTMSEFVKLGISQDKCSVIYNFSTLDICDKEIDKKIDKKNEKTKFLFIGSIDERKGLFDVLKILKDNNSNAILNVCGGFNGEQEEKKFFDYKKQLGDKMRFYGYVSGQEKKKIFMESDVLILPSYGEGLPIVIIEALSAGCAIISSNVGAIPEIITSHNGILIQPGNLKELKNAIDFYASENKQVLKKQQRSNYNLSKQYLLANVINKIAMICEGV